MLDQGLLDGVALGFESKTRDAFIAPRLIFPPCLTLETRFLNSFFFISSFPSQFVDGKNIRSLGYRSWQRLFRYRSLTTDVASVAKLPVSELLCSPAFSYEGNDLLCGDVSIDSLHIERWSWLSLRHQAKCRSITSLYKDFAGSFCRIQNGGQLLSSFRVSVYFHRSTSIISISTLLEHALRRLSKVSNGFLCLIAQWS